MQVVLHYPKDEKALAELSKRVADVHSEAVYSYLKKLTCPKEQKLELLKAVQEDLKNGK